MAYSGKMLRKIKNEHNTDNILELDSEDMNLSYLKSVSSLSGDEPAIILSVKKPSKIERSLLRQKSK